MNSVRKRKGWDKPLTLKQILGFASSRFVFSGPTWTRIAMTFAVNPEIVETLRSLSGQIPAAPSADPLISAIRRICHPSARLPQRHRRALAQIGTTELSFVQLALEEARTRSWRCLDRAPIGQAARWLSASPLAPFGPAASAKLASLAGSYNSLCVARFGMATEFVPSMAWIEEVAIPADQWLLVEGPIAQALFLARIGRHSQAKEHLQGARKTLDDSIQDDLVDLRVFLSLTTAWIETLASGDEAKVECLLTEALGALPEEADPWLALFLHHECANAAITFVVCRIASEDILQRLRIADPTGPFSKDKMEQIFLRLQRVFYDHGSAEADAILRALTHLEACENLYEEFRTDRLAVIHDWLWAHALVHSDPIEGVDRLVRAITLALELGLGERLDPMSKDLFYLISQLSRVQDAGEKRKDCLARVFNTLERVAKSQQATARRNSRIPEIASLDGL